jgi:hypothetical protein
MNRSICIDCNIFTVNMYIYKLDKALSIGLIMVLTHKFTIQLDKALSIGLIMILTHKFTIPLYKALSKYYNQYRYM